MMKHFFMIALFLICAVACEEFEEVDPQADPDTGTVSDELEAENNIPEDFTVNAVVNGNTTELFWNIPEDIDGDTLTYSVILSEDTLASNLSEASFELKVEQFEKEFKGQVIAFDGKGGSRASDFTFESGKLFLRAFESFLGEDIFQYDPEDRNLTFLQNQQVDFEITRDDLGRIIQSGEMKYNYNTAGFINTIESSTGSVSLEYNNKNLLVRTTSTNTSFNEEKIRVIRNLTYDENERLIKVNERIIEFNDNPDFVTEFSFSYDQNDNISEQLLVVIGQEGQRFPIDTVQFEYDDKKNPWTLLATDQINMGIIHIDHFDVLRASLTIGNSVFFRVSWFSNNNIVKRVKKTNNGIFTRETEYIYNEEGYPVSAENTRTRSDNEEVDISFNRWTYLRD